MRSVTVLFLLTVGCASPYHKFYSDKTGGEDIKTLARFDLESGEPTITHTESLKPDGLKLQEDGFECIGVTSFVESSLPSDAGAIKQARRVSASRVLISTRYIGTSSGVAAYTSPTTNTSYSQFNGTYTGGTYSGTAVTTTYGERTDYERYSYDFYKTTASFWARLKPQVSGPQVSGIFYRKLSPSEETWTADGLGVMVVFIKDDSPGSRAEIAPGDLIRSIEGKAINTIYEFDDALLSHIGQTIHLGIFRLNKTLQVELILDPLADSPQPRTPAGN